MYPFVKSLQKADHIRRYSIQPTSAGWEVREEQDSEILRHSFYQDWHRVERALRSWYRISAMASYKGSMTNPTANPLERQARKRLDRTRPTSRRLKSPRLNFSHKS